MAAKRKIQWLIGEVEQLREKAVIDSQVAAVIKNHYQPQLERNDNSASKAGIAILATVGALLIGGGIILLFAHNWCQFSRPLRAVLSILPVIFSAALMCFCVVRAKGRSWREAATALMMTSAISCFALICQTYYLGGEFSTFMFYVALMTLFVPLILSSLMGFILQLLIIIVWLGSNFDYNSENKLYVGLKLALLVAAPIIYYVMSLRKRAGWEKVLNSWLISLATGILVCMAMSYFIEYENYYSTVIYLAIGVIISGTARIFYYNSKYMRNCSLPFIVVGFFMTLIPLIEVQVGDFYNYSYPEVPLNFVMILFSFMALVVGLFCLRKRIWLSAALAFIPSLFLVLVTISMGKSDYPAIVISIIVGVISLVGIILAMNKKSLEMLNYSTLLLLSTILVRFFDSEFSILARAIVFIVCGIGLLVMNGFVVVRNRKATQAQEVL